MAGFIDLFQTPMSRSAVAGEVTTQLMYLEASEGLLSKILEAERAVQDVRERAKGELIEEVLEDGSLRVVNQDHPLYPEYQMKAELARALSDELLHRATSNDAGALMMRGLMGFYSQSVPQ